MDLQDNCPDQSLRSSSSEEDPRPSPEAVSLSDLLGETRVLVSQIAKELGVHCSTCTRWCFTGCWSKTSRAMTRLEYLKVGGRLYTSREAFERFIARLNDPAVIGEAGVTIESQKTARTPAQRRKASEQAAAEARRLGC
jgi:hypothetical protein